MLTEPPRLEPDLKESVSASRLRHGHLVDVTVSVMATQKRNSPQYDQYLLMTEVIIADDTAGLVS